MSPKNIGDLKEDDDLSANAQTSLGEDEKPQGDSAEKDVSSAGATEKSNTPAVDQPEEEEGGKEPKDEPESKVEEASEVEPASKSEESESRDVSESKDEESADQGMFR